MESTKVLYLFINPVVLWKEPEFLTSNKYSFPNFLLFSIILSIVLKAMPKESLNALFKLSKYISVISFNKSDIICSKLFPLSLAKLFI